MSSVQLVFTWNIQIETPCMCVLKIIDFWRVYHNIIQQRSSHHEHVKEILETSR